MTIYPISQGPFDIWQGDIFGPASISATGNCYIFIAMGMFSKYVYVRDIPNTNTRTVSDSLFLFFIQFGVYDSILRDQGLGFVDIPHQFTPVFVHKCFGTCERMQKTFAERLTLNVIKDKN